MRRGGIIGIFILAIIACGPRAAVDDGSGTPGADDPNRAEKEYSIAYEYLKMANYPEARDHLAAAIACDSGFYAAYIALGQAYRALRDTAAAESTYQRAKRLRPADSRAFEGLAAIYADRREIDRALAEYGQALGFDSLNVNLWSGIGFLHTRARRLNEAAAAYERAFRIEPGNLNCAFALALVYAELDQPDPAIELLEDLKDKHPDNAEIRRRLAEIYVKARRQDEAAREYVSLIAQEPDNASYRLELGRIHMKQKNYSAAILEFEAAGRLAPAAPGPILMQADAAIAQNRLGRAEELVRQALALAPDNAYARLLLADVHERRGYQSLQAWEKNRTAANLASAQTALAELNQAIGYYNQARADAQYEEFAAGEIGRCGTWVEQLKEDIWYFGGKP